jgi:protein-arginine kinase activator protein McsA
MKCKKCDEGRLMVNSSRYENGVFVRYRICDKCGYKVQSAEVPYELYSGIKQFIELIRDISKVLT